MTGRHFLLDRSSDPAVYHSDSLRSFLATQTSTGTKLLAPSGDADKVRKAVLVFSMKLIFVVF